MLIKHCFELSVGTSATCSAMLTTTKHCKFLVDVRLSQLFSKLAAQRFLCLRYFSGFSQNKNKCLALGVVRSSSGYLPL